MDKKLLDILVCPVTGAALQPLDDSQRERLNERLRAGELYYSDGEAVREPLSDGLITADGHTVYRIDDEIPVMLPERSIPYEDVAGR